MSWVILLLFRCKDSVISTVILSLLRELVRSGHLCSVAAGFLAASLGARSLLWPLTPPLSLSGGGVSARGLRPAWPQTCVAGFKMLCRLSAPFLSTLTSLQVWVSVPLAVLLLLFPWGPRWSRQSCQLPSSAWVVTAVLPVGIGLCQVTGVGTSPASFCCRDSVWPLWPFTQCWLNK